MRKKKSKATEKDKQTNSKKSPRADSKKKDEQYRLEKVTIWLQFGYIGQNEEVKEQWISTANH